MTQDEAMQIVRTMRFAAQKFRSNNDELGGFDGVENVLYPWLYDDRCILPLLARIEDAGHVDGGTFGNLLYIWNRPEMALIYGLYHATYGGPELPEWSVEIIADLGGLT